MIDIIEVKFIEQVMCLFEQKFVLVFYYCLDMVVLVNGVDGCFFVVNSIFEQQIGIVVDDVIGKIVIELGIWVFFGLGLQVLEKFGYGNLINFEVFLWCCNGSIFSVLFSVQYVVFDQILVLVVVICDIIYLVEIQELLWIFEEKFVNVFYVYFDGLLISYFEDGMLIDVNEGFICFIGYCCDEVIFCFMFEFGLWVDIEDCKCLILLVCYYILIQGFIVFVWDCNGGICQCEMFVYWISIDGEDCVLIIVCDIIECQFMQEKLQQVVIVFESIVEGVMIIDIC